VYEDVPFAVVNYVSTLVLTLFVGHSLSITIFTHKLPEFSFDF